MVAFDQERLKLKENDDELKYINYISKYIEDNSQLDFLIVRNILLIVINEKLYYKCKDNKMRFLTLLALASLKKDNKLNAHTNEVVRRMNVIYKYFNIRYPSIIDGKVYFKPDKDKIEKLIEKAKNQVNQGKYDNVIFYENK